MSVGRRSFLRYIEGHTGILVRGNDIMKAKQLSRETIRNIGVRERDLPEFEIGDKIAVSLRVKEGGKERIQIFEGDVIARHKKGASSSFIVRKITNGVGVERILPYHSPLIETIKVVRRGKVRRAKLYYVRDRIGKAARIPEKKKVKKVAAERVQEPAQKVDKNA